MKQKLNCDMTLDYRRLPKDQNSFADALTNGIFYGRLRFHEFFYENPNDHSQDHQIAGVGGSMIYKSGYLSGVGFTTALYTSYNPWHLADAEASIYKSGKDTLSRYDAATEGDYALNSLAQAYIEYRDKQSSLKIGRQRFESFLVKSNDTKMIPNTFEGVSLETRLIPSTRMRTALFTKQKLRDHSEFHHVIAYDDSSEPYAKWLENDDGGMHQGLTVSKLQANGIDDRLLVLDFKNTALEKTVLRLNYTAVPELISSVTVEGTHRFDVDESKVMPSLRIMQQFDEGAGAIGGANLMTNTIGYQNPDSLKARLVAARIDFIQEVWSLRFGYSSVSDEGDIVAPWRGFPTLNYSRAMGQKNWQANTDTFLIRADYNLGRAGIIPTMRIMSRYAIQNFDDSKPGVPSDSRVWTLNMVKKGFPNYPTLYGKIRFAHVESERNTVAIDGTIKPDDSYNELRLELNYLF